MNSGTSSAAPEVPRSVAAWRRWLGTDVLPYWTEKLVSEPAGYIEFLTDAAVPDGRREKTTLVTARLVYSFSHAHVLGLGAGALAAAEHGFRFLTERCWDHAEGGFHHQVIADGEALDNSKHAYDMAFVLLAMAWFHRASGRRESLDWVARTIDYLDAELRDADTGGYRPLHRPGSLGAEALPCELNGQMHALEAFHAIYDATGDGAWLARAETVVGLLGRRLLDAETGSIGEIFTADWRPAAGPAGRLREPGNQFEIVWMLHNHARLTGDRCALDLADRLYRFALSRGFETQPHLLPAAFAQVDRDGAVRSGVKPFWAQTEAIKAALARVEILGDVAAARFARVHLAMLFERYLIDRTGRWRNQLTRDGRSLPTELPARVLYHLVLCFAETMRLWPELASASADCGEEAPFRFRLKTSDC
jgi:mannose/cellobiose epimerase-like protein (N-acyl-D-glucosamine 2-epimerase family)